MSTPVRGPGPVVQSRIATCRGTVEACLDTSKTAWARVLDGEWLPWKRVAFNVIDVDVAAASDTGSDMIAVVVVTHALPSASREIHAVASDGTVTGTDW
jgi:hypothetical protein